MAYSFTHPIRYYKANDPYYYEVDNIPLRQLEENVLYLKDIVAGDSNLGGVLTSKSELDLRNIKQLRPTVEGTRGIKVNAGWFNARINDVYSTSEPLLKLMNQSSPEGGGPTIIPNLEQVWDSTKKETIWNAFLGTDETPYNMNGLEITYTFHQSPGGMGGNWGAASNTNTRLTGEGSEAYPKYNSANSLRWPLQTSSRLTPADLARVFGINLLGSAAYSYDNLQDIHLAFVKVWRSPFRTAVVDFPESVIQIPSFSDYDYQYTDAGGTPHPILGANQRIDLLVAYSVPIDTQRATLGDYSDNWCVVGSDASPTAITSPRLGLIRGAGIGIRQGLDPQGGLQSIDTVEGCSETFSIAPGTNKILANVNDTGVAANQGLSNKNGVKIHGSFPSPDDLVNLAPILALDVEGEELGDGVAENAFQLIGQTALPIAYIVVTEGQLSLNAADILDIRPFMRTAELTYNERAGVAAANPPLSLANPAIGAFQLQNVIDELDIGDPAQASLDGKIIYADYIQGGLAYGVEGTLLTMCDQNNQKANDPWGSVTRGVTAYNDTAGGDPHNFSTLTSSKAFLEEASAPLRKAVLEYFYKSRQSDVKKWLSDPGEAGNFANYLGFPTPRNISLFPEWDMPIGAYNYQKVMSDPTTKSPEATWWMWIEGVDSNRPYTYVPGAVPSAVTSPDSAYLRKLYQQGYGNPTSTSKDNLAYFTITCSKRFEVTLPVWCTDYEVLADYSQCTPFTASIAGDSTNGTAGLHISKGPVMSVNGQNKAVFTINSTSTPLPAYSNGMIQGGNLMDEEGETAAQSSEIKTRLYEWLSYSVITPQTRQDKYGTGVQSKPSDLKREIPKIGASYYPTVGFKIIGFEKNPILNNLGGTSTLRSTGTYIPNTINAGSSHDNLTGTYAPIYEKSFIDLS